MKNDMYTVKIDQEAIDNFKKAFCDCIIKPNFWQPSGDSSYNELRKVFNRRFDFMPSLIIQPHNTEHVAIAIQYATDNNIQITVKSGGHDHEGECVATGKVLIDFALMNKTDASLKKYLIDKREVKQISIQPGAKFKSIKEVLDKEHLGIPHGTCQSVAIAGYTMGGGWGPWTRKYGMGCERLMGATIVLGNGTVKYLGSSAFYNKEKANNGNIEGAESKLLWAIRGGGGLSYGIVTEFFYEPFELPEIASSFHISYNMLPVFKKIKATAVIEAWESITAPGKNNQLIGTNLKVVAKQVASKKEVSENAVLDWTLNGHFGGTREELKTMMIEWGSYLVKLIENDPDFNKEEKAEMITAVIEGLKIKFDELTNDTHISTFTKGATNGYPYTFESWDRYSVTAKENGLSLETDCPAPHKITSRMPTNSWDDKSREQLVCSLQSTLLKGIEETNISSYITLGAIQGDFYATKKAREKSALKCAFPFQERAFTIQYQTWWDMPTQTESDCKCKMDENTIDKVIPTRFYSNRALDWMEECRDYIINETNGSFISFKDASVPTKNYFVDNYEKLIDIKLDYSEDKKCIFKSRKTIL
ncbi:FAD-dependent oxidoreductase [Tenacibaculum ovolyticum]|uniref:FAD-binding oxidoreductase n=1 Tax=Tenacibaculum ovolyticum TaxID=104270 RepID=UPI0022F3ECEA|nr:FAD-dependent oxidoreductase [Tenacibaculum ovolyticum]WBX75221.1 FAD-dependent oxidoreductase [Tenacibaculum ovolyticum]